MPQNYATNSDILLFSICILFLGWHLLRTTLSYIIFNVFYPSSVELFLMQCNRSDLSFVESFTAWYWVCCYLQIREEMYLWYGTVVDLSLLCWCGVQFANWKIMRVIMANHSLKFICWAFFFFSSVLSVNEMTEKNDIRILYYLIILTHLIIWKKPLLVYNLNIYILNKLIIIPSAEPHCGWLNIHWCKTVCCTRNT